MQLTPPVIVTAVSVLAGTGLISSVRYSSIKPKGKFIEIIWQVFMTEGILMCL